MLVCVSANPGLDTRKRIGELRPGSVHRVQSFERFAVGKAAHVAVAAQAMGAPALLIGLFGGATGETCQRALAEAGIFCLPIRTAAATRENLELVDEHGQATELLEKGGPVSSQEVEALISACAGLFRRLRSAATVVLSGSLPAGVPSDLFARLVGEAKRNGATTLVDTSGEALLAAAVAGPDWLKPNRSEAAAAVQAEIPNAEAALDAARVLRGRGAERVVLSLGEDGLVGVDASEAFSARCPTVVGRSAVGSGDSVVAALATSVERHASFADALRLAAAAGSANCLAPTPGSLLPQDLERMLAQAELVSL
jgi:1-phosphofructokinase family hexose kinase